MASLEKLVKAFEALKVFQPGAPDETPKKKDVTLSKKEKIAHCHVITDCIISSNMRNVGDFPKFLGIAMETFLALCDDPEADVRMASDECLNITMKSLLETNLGRLQVELYKEIKKNGSPRSLRAALWRFADLCHLIRPQKCRPYIVNLLPCLARICRRPEESIQETLAIVMMKICPILMSFATDLEVRVLLKAFLPNLASSSATMRRTSATSITLICQSSRKPQLFFSWMLTGLLDRVIPVQEDHDAHTVLGVLLTLRNLLPYLGKGDTSDRTLRGSFGVKTSEREVKIGREQLVQVFELLLYHTGDADHNLVTAALETLQQLLRTMPEQLQPVLLSKAGIKRHTIFQRAQELGLQSKQGSTTRLPFMGEDGSEEDLDGSEASVTGSDVGVDDQPLMSDLEPLGVDSDNRRSSVDTLNDIGDDLEDNEAETENEELSGAADDVKFTTDGDYANIEIGYIEEDSEKAMSHSSSTDTLSDSRTSPKHKSLFRIGASDDKLHSRTPSGEDTNSMGIDVSESIQSGTITSAGVVREGDIGDLLDRDIPLVHCARLLCTRFLLTGYPRGLIPDKQVRVSVKSLALACVSSIISICPKTFLAKVHKSSQAKGELQSMRDVLLYANHSDPQLKGTSALLLGSFIQAVLRKSTGSFSKWIRSNLAKDEENVLLEELVCVLTSVLEDDSSVACRLGLTALRACLVPVINSTDSALGLRVLLAVLQLKQNPYWLVKVGLLELLSEVDFAVVHYLENVCLETRRGKHHYAGHLNLQDHVIKDVIIPLLGDEDQRVRQGAASAIVKMIPQLFHVVDNPQHDPVVAKAKAYAMQYFEPMLHEWSQMPQPLVHGLVAPYHLHPTYQPLPTTEASLMRVVSVICSKLNHSNSKYLMYGCIRALSELSAEYQVTMYPGAWGCMPVGGSSRGASISHHRRNLSTGSAASVTSIGSTLSGLSVEELGAGSGSGPLPIVLSLLTSSSLALDLTAHQDALHLTGNLFAGAAYKCLRTPEEGGSGTPEDTQWSSLGDRFLVPTAESLMLHLARMLNICTHVIEDQSPGPPASKTSLPSLPNAPSLSPIKRKAKMKDDSGGGSAAQAGQSEKTQGKTPNKDNPKDSEEKKNKKDGLGLFYNLPHYMKLFEVLRGAYSIYKISLDLGNSDKFGTLLRTVLQVLSQLLEVAGLVEVGRHAEELLHYLRSTVTLESAASILCVQQLLKALFGTNLMSQWGESSSGTNMSRKPGKATRLTSSMKPGIYHSCFTAPYTQFTQCLATATLRTATHFEQEDTTTMLGWLKKKAERKIPAILKPGSKTDKSSIASFIRLFEPLVIKALKQYTITSSLELQEQVLNLLTELVQLRVNYCLLDSDQIFIGFVIKQFEYIEEGQIRNSEKLITPIFNFLVLLSYEKYHSKLIIGMPKIIQLCDGIMASGQQPDSHAIPALECIVQDLFVQRAGNKMESGKDLDTQREVVVSMLLRLIQYYQVLELFIIILHQCHKEGEDRWKKLSRQVTDTVLPLLSKQQVNLDSQVALDVVHRLFEAVAPSVFRPVDILLKALFAEPLDLAHDKGLQRWACLVLLVLQVIIAQSKEEVVLSRMQELGLGITVFSTSLSNTDNDDCSVSSSSSHAQPYVCSTPEQTMSRFLLQVVGVIVEKIKIGTTVLTTDPNSYDFICQQLARLLLYITHMFQSGVYRRVANICMGMIEQAVPEGMYDITEINAAFLKLSSVHPLLTLQWCYILILLNYDDQNWWSSVLQTPRKYRMSNQAIPGFEQSESSLQQNRSCNLEIVRRGGLILFCDYVCENLNDAEHMTWVIINHVSDLIHQSLEPPVQDIVSAIHRNSAASGLLIQAIHSRCENFSRPSLVKKTLHCLEAIHSTQSGALLTLLVDKFLMTSHLAVARLCDTIACRRVEMLLAETADESQQQLPLEDLKKLLQFMDANKLTQKHARLSSLLHKLRKLIEPSSRKGARGDDLHPLATLTSSVADFEIDKELFIRVAREQCYNNVADTRQCAKLLQYLDYSSILSIIMTKECNLMVIKECLALGLARTLQMAENLKDAGPTAAAQATNSPSRGRSLDPLLQAAQLTLFRHINNIINQIPVPHQLLTWTSTSTAMNNDDCRIHTAEEQYREKMDDMFSDVSWCQDFYHLVSSLVHYLVCLPQLPWQSFVPEESAKDICRFSVLCLELIHWTMEHDHLPSSTQLQMAVECYSLVLQNRMLCSVVGQKEQTSWVCAAIRAIHQLLVTLVVAPGDRLVTLPHHDLQEDSPEPSLDDLQHSVRACDQMSDLVNCLRTHLDHQQPSPQVPPFLSKPLRNIVIGLARLPLVNSYARTPPLVWRLGWMPSPSGDLKTRLPPLPLDFLIEKDILRDFIFRVNMLGWTSRQQFEETWMSLLGVLNPVALSDTTMVSPEEDVDRAQCVVLATRCITALLVQSSLSPQAGNPSNSLYDHRPRDKSLAFVETRVGRKLTRIRGAVEKEIQHVTKNNSRQDSPHCYSHKSSASPRSSQLYVQNLDKEPGDSSFSFGQISVEAIWGLLGMLDASKILQDPNATGDAASAANGGNEGPPETTTILPAVGRLGALTASSVQRGADRSPSVSSHERSAAVSGLDIHSCLQFLLELYGQFLAPNAEPHVPLMQLNETIKSVVALSDLFTERHQFEWMLDALLEVNRTHPTEDELVNNYLVVGICKAAAIVGLELSTTERIMKVMEASLKSTHLPCKLGGLYGCLYILEAGMSQLTQHVISLVSDYLVKMLSSITQATIHSQQHLLLMWTTSFYIMENYQHEVRDSDFIAKIFQLAVVSVSAPEDATPLVIYMCILRGLERLLLAGVLLPSDADTLVKLSVDRLCLPSAQRSLAALGLMLTCMYSATSDLLFAKICVIGTPPSSPSIVGGKHGDRWSPTQEIHITFPLPPSHTSIDPPADPEALIVAMERVTVLFDRIRKGFPYEARVITRILPTFLADFFPPQDIMNKVIGEFLSSQQPHPQLMAKVVFQVFDSLLERHQRALVNDWVMLSLSNFTQRTPASMAVWSLTCFFISASSNMWLRALFPHVISRMGRLDPADRNLFCISAMNFRRHLIDNGQVRAFSSTFQAVAVPDSPYAQLLAALS